MSGVLKYTVIRRHPETMTGTAILKGQPVPAWAKGLVHADDLTPPNGADQGTGDGLFDPSAQGVDVDEVNNHLAESDEDEVKRVIALEVAGKNRKGVVEGPYAPDESA